MQLDFEEPLEKMDARISELTRLTKESGGKFSSEISELQGKLESLKKSTYERLTPWQTVQVARHPERPLLRDYIEGMFDEFIELHGDRSYGDDSALIGGFARLNAQKVMLIGMHKGKTVEEKEKCNFGMPNPEGYRKALRLMRLAVKYRLPVVCLVDTPAAYPGKEAEERGQAEAIARNITEMTSLETPILVVVTGEGGSGGALGVGVGDVVLMLAHSTYSVIPPEGCAAILWREAAKAPEAAEALKLTAKSLFDMGIVDEIVPEPPGGAHRDREAVFSTLKDVVLRHLKQLKRVSTRRLVERRYQRYSRIGRPRK
jgi:acetyl-CoA carboxylase carboxyl transferase subunit alpha